MENTAPLKCPKCQGENFVVHISLRYANCTNCNTRVNTVYHNAEKSEEKMFCKVIKNDTGG